MSKQRHFPRSLGVRPESIDKESVCWQIFTAFRSSSVIHITKNQIYQFCDKELQIPRAKTAPSFYDNVPAMLTYFINVWPGRKFKEEIQPGSLKERHIFQSFKKFIQDKFGIAQRIFPHVMKGAYESRFGEDCGAPLRISITCPANMLNSIAFAKVGDDILIKECPGTSFYDLTDSQLVNWPYIEVSFQTDDLLFVRRQATEFVRFLDSSPHDGHKSTPDIIENIESFSGQQCYSIDYIEKYIETYVESLKTLLPTIGLEKMFEIQTILAHFLKDIKHIDVNQSMATNTIVLFKMSDASFVVNKKLVSEEGDKEQLWYCKVITPKVMLMLLYFTPKQENTEVLSFEYTDKIKNSQRDKIQLVPRIAYKCTFCKEECKGFNSKREIKQHIMKNHKMEENVSCTLCHEEFVFPSLVACRWKHDCH